jgi:hypothetical protein
VKLRYQFILLFSIVIACSNRHSPKQVVVNSDTIKKDRANDRLKKIWHKEDSLSMEDSLYKIKTLAVALSYAEKNKDKDSFTYNSQKLLFDSSKLSMEYGRLFGGKFKHLIVRLPPMVLDTSYLYSDLLSEAVVVSVYVLKDNSFKLIFKETSSRQEYIGDTIEDLNGDGDKDFIYQTYGTNGCCPRENDYIGLYKSDSGTFKEFELFDPVYIPKARIAYTMTYGHPEEIAIYKCKWNRYELDTIGDLSADREHKNVFIIDDYKTGKIKKVKGIPQEYLYADRDKEWLLGAWDK